MSASVSWRVKLDIWLTLNVRVWFILKSRVLARFADRLARPSGYFWWPGSLGGALATLGIAAAILAAAITSWVLASTVRVLDEGAVFSGVPRENVTAFGWEKAAGLNLRIGTETGTQYLVPLDSPASATRTTRQPKNPVIGFEETNADPASPLSLVVDDESQPTRRQYVVQTKGAGHITVRGLFARLSDGTLLTATGAAQAGAIPEGFAGGIMAQKAGDEIRIDAAPEFLAVPGNILKLKALPNMPLAVAATADGHIYLIGRSKYPEIQAPAPLIANPFVKRTKTAITSIAVAANPVYFPGRFAFATADGFIGLLDKDNFGLDLPENFFKADEGVVARGPKAEWVEGAVYRTAPGGERLMVGWPDEKDIMVFTNKERLISPHLSDDPSGDEARGIDLKLPGVGFLIDGPSPDTFLVGGGLVVIPGKELDGIAVVERATGKQLRTIGKGAGTVRMAAVDNTTAIVAAVMADGSIRIYNFKSGNLVQTINTGMVAQHLAFGQLGAVLMVQGTPARILVFEVQTGQKIAEHRLTDFDSTRQISWSADGKFLNLSFEKDVRKTINWRTGSGEVAPGSSTGSLKFSQDRKLALKLDDVAPLEIIDNSHAPKLVGTLNTGNRRVADASLDETGSRIWLLFWDGSYSMWTRDPKNEGETIPLPPLAEDGLRIAANGAALLARTQQGALYSAQLINEKGIVVSAPQLHAFEPALVAIDAEISADGQRVFVAGEDGMIRVRHLPWSTQRDFDISGHGELVYRLSLSPDGTKLASASTDGRIRLTDVARQERIAWLPFTSWPTGPAQPRTVPRLINRVPLASPSAGGGNYPPIPCLPGYVFREAVPTDYVCVTPQERDETAIQNKLADSRRSTTDTTYGPNTCVQGYVWREAYEGDVVCVTPERRARAKADNSAVATRTQAVPEPAQSQKK